MLRVPSYHKCVIAVVLLFTVTSYTTSFSSSPVVLLVDAKELVNVHIIAHSHCDPGWLETFEGYYTKRVNKILTNVVQELSKNAKRRFVWSEISFFDRWWNDIDEQLKSKFRALLENGQLEFLGGGWVQNDEANPDLSTVINQVTSGHEYIRREFGERYVPRVAWQIDPFGHSALTPSAFRLMGFEALVLNRIHYAVKDRFKHQKQMEFIWQGSEIGGGKAASMMVHVLHSHYSSPKGFDFERRRHKNVNEAKARQLANMMIKRAKDYRTNNLLQTFGDDFKYMNAENQFSSIDEYIAMFDKDPEKFGIRLIYSTPQTYFEALARENLKWPTYDGDFFPYADNKDSYWTGYFSTRPTMKRFSRQNEFARRTAEIMHAMLPSSEAQGAEYDVLENARRQSALFLHHDAITGTCKRHVMDDYLKRMRSSYRAMQKITEEMVMRTLTRIPHTPPRFTQDAFKMEPGSVYPVALTNSLAWRRAEIVTVQTTTPYVQVFDSNGRGIISQVDRSVSMNGGSGRFKVDKHYLVHFVAQLKALSVHTYYVRVHTRSDEMDRSTGPSATPSRIVIYTRSSAFKSKSSKSAGRGGTSPEDAAQEDGVGDDAVEHHELEASSTLSFTNNHLQADFSPVTGLVSSISHLPSSTTIQAAQTYGIYRTTRSGAYLFRPEKQAQTLDESAAQVCTTHGSIRHSIVTHYGTSRRDKLWMEASMPADSSVPFLNADVLKQVTHVAVEGNEELFTRFDTDLDETAVMDTHNGLDFVNRGHPKTGFKFAAAANHYPMVAGARLRSTKESVSKSQRFSVHNMQTMSVGTQSVGSMEIVMQRSLKKDDGRGMGQAMTDSSTAHITLFLSVGGKAKDHHADALADADAEFIRDSILFNQPPTVLYGREAGEHSSAGRSLLRGWNAFDWTSFMFENLKDIDEKRIYNAAEALESFGALEKDIPSFSDKELQSMGIEEWRIRKDIMYATDLYRATHSPGDSVAESDEDSDSTDNTDNTDTGAASQDHVHQTVVRDTPAAVSSATSDSFGSDPRVTAVRNSMRSFVPFFGSELASKGLPPNVHLFSFFADERDAEHVVVRLQSLDGPTFEVGADKLFEGPMLLRATGMEHRTADLAHKIQKSDYLLPSKMKLCTAAGDDVVDTGASKPLEHHHDNVERQNTDEEGVFISDAALDEIEHNHDRSLLSIDGHGELLDTSGFYDAPGTTHRHLLGFSGEPLHSLHLSGRQLRAFKFEVSRATVVDVDAELNKAELGTVASSTASSDSTAPSDLQSAPSGGGISSPPTKRAADIAPSLDALLDSDNTGSLASNPQSAPSVPGVQQGGFAYVLRGEHRHISAVSVLFGTFGIIAAAALLYMLFSRVRQHVAEQEAVPGIKHT
jgi:alpha-mannosidase II